MTSMMKLSIILPLFDLRDALEKPLASLISQNLERAKYEIVVVIPERDRDFFLGQEPYGSLLTQCDKIIFVNADPNNVESEILFYSAGCDAADGDLLFFIEGHTEILEDACSSIYQHFFNHPECVVAWGLRINHNEKALGKLIGMHNLHHENIAKQDGWFTFGGNSIIRKSVFEDLVNFEPSYARFNESMVFEKLTERNIAVEKLDFPISIHYNDMSIAHLTQITFSMGRGRSCYYRLNSSQDSTKQNVVNHKMTSLVNGRFSALLFFPAIIVIGFLLLHLARVIFVVHNRIAYRIFVSGLGFCDLLGYIQVQWRHLEH